MSLETISTRIWETTTITSGVKNSCTSSQLCSPISTIHPTTTQPPSSIPDFAKSMLSFFSTQLIQLRASVSHPSSSAISLATTTSPSRLAPTSTTTTLPPASTTLPPASTTLPPASTTLSPASTTLPPTTILIPPPRTLPASAKAAIALGTLYALSVAFGLYYFLQHRKRAQPQPTTRPPSNKVTRSLNLNPEPPHRPPRTELDGPHELPQTHTVGPELMVEPFCAELANAILVTGASTCM